MSGSSSAPPWSRPATRSPRPRTARPPSTGSSDRPSTSSCSTSRCPAWAAWTSSDGSASAGNDVPVVIITAHGSIPDAVAAMKLGAIDFLSKPLTPDVLRTVVAEVLARHADARARAGRAVERARPPSRSRRPRLDLTPAKRALNRREFDEAEVFLKQAHRPRTRLGRGPQPDGRPPREPRRARRLVPRVPRRPSRPTAHYEPASTTCSATTNGSASTAATSAINPAASDPDAVDSDSIRARIGPDRDDSITKEDDHGPRHARPRDWPSSPCSSAWSRRATGSDLTTTYGVAARCST